MPDFDVLELCAGVPCAYTDTPFVQRKSFGKIRILQRQQRVGPVLCEQFLHIIRRRAVGAVVVEYDKVHRPFAVVLVVEQRCIGRHVNDVAVVLHADHERRLAYRRFEVTFAARLVGGIFTDKHLG